MTLAPENFLQQALSLFHPAGLSGHLSMVQLTNDPFLNELNKMYERNKDKGTVWVTLKRSAFRTAPPPLVKHRPVRPAAHGGPSRAVHASCHCNQSYILTPADAPQAR